MHSSIIAPLVISLRPHFDLSKARLTTLCVLIAGLALSRTVNLSHLACMFPSGAKIGSNYRRLQRFFQFVRLDGDVTARLIVRVLLLDRTPMVLALDRTNWQLGARDINMLVLAVVTPRFRVPLMWTILARAGNSSTPQRIALMTRFLRVFGAAQVQMLLADREFVGARWMEFLNENNVAFAIRLRSSQILHRDDAYALRLNTLFRNRQRAVTAQGWLGKMEHTNRNRIALKARLIKGGEALIIATNTGDPARALNMYRKRWGIECLFADAKTRGLNLEDTHITNPDKLETLLSVIALAITWAYRCASTARGRASIPNKSHGRPAKSWFREGFDHLRAWLFSNPEHAMKAWAERCPRRKMQIAS